jgi:hypothetical protein
VRHPEINPVMLIICPSGRSFEVAVTSTEQASIIRRVKKILRYKIYSGYAEKKYMVGTTPD